MGLDEVISLLEPIDTQEELRNCIMEGATSIGNNPDAIRRARETKLRP